MRSLRVLPSADKDLDEAAIYYAEEAGAEVALRFLDAVQQAFDFVHANPAAGSPGQYRTRKLEGVRRWPVPGFKVHLVFYRFSDEWVDIVRVLHGARDIEGIFETAT